MNKVKQLIKFKRGNIKLVTDKEEAEQYVKALTPFIKQDSLYPPLYQAMIQGFLLENDKEAKRQFEVLIRHNPFFIQAHFQYWKYLHFYLKKSKIQKSPQIINLSNETIEKCNYTRVVPISEWVQARINKAKICLMKKEVQEAINTLKEICHILPPFPTLELIYVNEVCQQEDADDEEEGEDEKFSKRLKQLSYNRENLNTIADEYQSFRSLTKMSLLQNNQELNEFQDQQNFNFELQNMQKQKNEELKETELQIQTQRELGNREQLFDVAQEIIKEQAFKNKKENLNKIYFSHEKDEFNANEYFSRNSICVISKRFKIDQEGTNYNNYQSIKRKQNRVSFMQHSTLSRRSILDCQSTVSIKDSQINEMDQQQAYEIEGFSIYSDIKFLYDIGKIAAETGQCLEEGMKALNDYLVIWDYMKYDLEENLYYRSRAKAYFCIGLIFFKNNDFEAAQEHLNGVLVDLKDYGALDMYHKAQAKLSKIYQKNLENHSLIQDYFV